MPKPVRISEGAVSADDLFSEGRDGLLFEIRPPQRRFKWKDQQVLQLWDDIRTAYETKRDSYFLGTLLLVRLNEEAKASVSVIDGQQRLTTLSLLLAVLRDYCNLYPELSTRADTLQRRIRRVDHDGNALGPLVLTLQEPDNQVYIKYVEAVGSTKQISPGRDLISRAVKKLTEQVDNYINVPTPQEKLRRLCDFVQDNIIFLPLEVRNEGEGYLVFDTTNTRGMRLTPSESLKGRLASVAREDSNLSEQLITKWGNEARDRKSFY